jgi:hypothetical protein
MVTLGNNIKKFGTDTFANIKKFGTDTFAKIIKKEGAGKKADSSSESDTTSSIEKPEKVGKIYAPRGWKKQTDLADYVAGKHSLCGGKCSEDGKCFVPSDYTVASSPNTAAGPCANPPEGNLPCCAAARPRRIGRTVVKVVNDKMVRTMTMATCLAFKKAKFFNVFGRCNPGDTDRAKAIDDATVDGCNINWAQGNMDNDANGNSKGERCNHAFRLTAAAPGNGRAILGFDDQINKHCTGKKEVGSSCVVQGFNRLRLGRDKNKKCDGGEEHPTWDWTPCKNLHWLLCAAKGFLPAQSNKKILMVQNPRAIKEQDTDLEGDPPNVPWLADRGMNVSSADFRATGITIHEVCLLTAMCSNRDSLWDNDKGGFDFTCENPDSTVVGK